MGNIERGKKAQFDQRQAWLYLEIDALLHYLLTLCGYSHGNTGDCYRQDLDYQ